MCLKPYERYLDVNIMQKGTSEEKGILCFLYKDLLASQTEALNRADSEVKRL